MEYNGFINFITFGKVFGLKNLVLFYCKRWALCDLPLFLPVFGMITHREELLNIRDNILQGSIRDRRMEQQIGKAKEPVIVDCGVNVGVTARWWYYLNPHATVYGIDMMQEANDYTMRVLPDRFKARYVPITAVLASETGRSFELKYNDPLFGGNRVDVSGEYSGNRRVHSMTLDDCLQGHSIDAIDLLKVDIEGSAASMFRGAARTLSKTKNILLEIHSEEERNNSIGILSGKGFYVRKSHKRHVWLERTP